MPRKPTKPDADADVLVFRASLAPKLYREFEIGSASTLYDLALAIVTVFDFDFDHAFGFYSNLKGSIYDSPVAYELFFDMGQADGKARSVKRTRAADAFAKIGHKMRFLFDYGDGWEFLVEFKKRQPKAPGVKLPRVVLSMGQAPEQYPSEEDED
ncbi:MAG: hypothetical protein ABL996_06980 [Micropepsaceae bacterium]